MNILVTGGAGYIGSHVVMHLCEAGHDVMVIDDLSLGDKKAVDSKATFIQGSILNKEDLNRCLNDIETVIHLAAFKSAGESMKNPQKYSENNILGTLTLLQWMIEHRINNIIFSSTAAVYGYPEYLPLDEKHPLNPINFYGFTKLTIENMLGWYHKLLGMNYVILRYFNAAGYDKSEQITSREKNPANLIPAIMEVASGYRDKIDVFGDNYDTPDGTGMRDYIHVSDLAKAHVDSLDLIQANQSEIINLGSEQQYSVMDVLRLAEKISGKNIPHKIVDRRQGDPATIYASSEYARKVLNWSASLSSLENIIETTWRIYK
ncbi:MAG: UDP-glucose 4-epimerase GalE [Candidatus Neomarinimicrobiota bacterium]|nr:UDP-glucose 4-epimerase GalE [Candidatus Neomarinimicrobiota bacterium]